MLSLLRRKVCPIGIDLGGSSLKLVQLTCENNSLALVAAAQAIVPHELTCAPAELQEWYIENIKRLLSSKPFKGRKVVTCLPAREMLIQHLRMAKMDDEQLAKAVPWEAQSKIPFDVNHAMLRHVVAGEVYDGSESKLEVVLMAASRAVVKQHLNLIKRTKIEIDSISVEPYALINCFAHLLKDNENNQNTATMFIDLGYNVTKVVVCQASKLVFARTIGIGAEQIRQAISKRMGVSYDESVQLYYNLKFDNSKLKMADAALSSAQLETRKVNAAEGEAVTAVINQNEHDNQEETDAESCVSATLQRLCEEIRGCIRYHDLIFNASPVGRVIFLGGQAKNTLLCQRLAQSLGLAAQLGDPLARINQDTLIGRHSDLEKDKRHCEWAIAFGSSLGGSG